VFSEIAAVIGIMALVSCHSPATVSSLPYYNTPDFTPLFLTRQEALRSVDHRISSFSFTDQHGEKITDKTVRGKIHIANFLFTSCSSICPVMTRHLKTIEEEFGEDTSVVMLSFSVTPWIDSVPRLQQFARKYSIESPEWHLLTGSSKEIYGLARYAYFAEEDLGFTKDSSDFLHTEHVLLVDDTGRIRGIYNGTLQLDMIQLAADIKSLQYEKNRSS